MSIIKENFITFKRIADHQRFYSKLIRPASLCFDVGANYGEWTAALLSLDARVVAIEPHPDLAAFISRSLGGENERLTVVNAALGPKTGRARLYEASDRTMSMSTLSEIFVEISEANDRNGTRPKHLTSKYRQLID